MALLRREVDPTDGYVTHWVDCACGVDHELNPRGDSTCVCGQEYNAFGQKLASDWRKSVRYGGGDWDGPDC